MLTFVVVLVAQLRSGLDTEERQLQAISTMDAAVKKSLADGTLRPPVIVDLNQSLEIVPEQRALIEACERFVSSWPQSAKRAEVLFTAAHIYYQYNHFDEAVRRLTDVALNYPEATLPRPMLGESRLCSVASNLVMDAYRVRSRNQEMNVNARRFAASPCAAKDLRLQEEMRKYAMDASYLLARDQKDSELRADAYLQFADDFPTSDLADRALFNASLDYRHASLADLANETRQRLIKQYPESEFARRARKAIADEAKASPRR